MAFIYGAKWDITLKWKIYKSHIMLFSFNGTSIEFSKCYKAMDMYVTDELEESDSGSSSSV